MERIIDKNSTGKTRKLMMLAKENNATFVCKDPWHMEQKAIAYGITGLKITGYQIAFSQSLSSDDSFYIDDLESFALYVSKNIKGYTLSLD